MPPRTTASAPTAKTSEVPTPLIAPVTFDSKAESLPTRSREPCDSPNRRAKPATSPSSPAHALTTIAPSSVSLSRPKTASSRRRTLSLPARIRPENSRNDPR